MMNKILLVQQYLGDNKEVGPIFPIGLAYIATAIKEIGWNIRVLDMNIHTNPYQELGSIISSFTPDVIAISLRNIDNVDKENFNYFYLEFKRLITFVSNKDIVLIVGGAGFSIFAERIMTEITAIDYGISQEGEITISQLLEKLNSKSEDISSIKGIYFRVGSKIQFTGKRPALDFSKSKTPDRSYFEIEKYNAPLSMGVQTKRGCRLNCSYCTYPFLNLYSERFRNAKDVVDEIEQLHQVYSIKEIIFCDDIFNAPRQHAEDIILELMQRNFKIRWSAWFDIANTDIDFIRQAIASGCYRFCFSTEAVTDRSLTLLQKNFTMQQVRELVDIVEHYEFKDIDFRFSLFALPPGVKLLDLIKSLRFVYRTHSTRLNIKCLVSWIRVYPHTAIYESMQDKSMDLLPQIVERSKIDSLFWNESRLSKSIVFLYRKMLSLLDSLRRLKKRYLWGNKWLSRL